LADNPNKLEEDVKEVAKSHNVPEPTCYAGRFLVEIEFPFREQNIFKPDIKGEGAFEIPLASASLTSTVDEVSLKSAIIKGLTSGFSDENLFPNLRKFNGVIRFIEKPGSSDSKPTLEAISTEPISPKLARLDVDEIVSMMQAGKRLHIYRSMYGSLTYDYIKFDDLDIKKESAPDDVPYGPRSFDTYERYICINCIGKDNNEIIPPNGANLSGTSGFCVTVRGSARPKRRDGSYTDKGHRRHELPPVIYQVQKVNVSFRTLPEAGSFEGTATQERPGSWEDWSFSHDVLADDPSGSGQKSFIITATAYYESPIEPADISIGIVVSFTRQAPGHEDTTPPNVRITSPQKGDNRTGDYRGATVSIEGNASDNPGGCGIKTVEVTVDDDIGLYTEATPKSPYNWSTWRVSKTIFTEGVHSITARCTDNDGNVKQDRISITVTITPGLAVTSLLLIERYRLSSYPGNYTAGRIINTITLLPGEKAEVSLKTFTSAERDRKQASCILDSFTQTSSDEFETSLARENTDKQNYYQNYKYYVDTDVEAGWGGSSCNLTSATVGGTNSAREEFAKNVSNVIHKHASMASARRDMQINTSCEVKGKTEDEQNSKCEIKNINLSRTLNFVFRQMNQEFISLLHLVDLRVAILRKELIQASSCLKITYREVTLPQLDAFLDEVLVKDDRELKQKVTDFILNQLYRIFDYQGNQRSFVEDESFKDPMGKDIHGSNYLRVKKDLISKYVDPTYPHGKIQVPGVIMSVTKNVLRTEGVVVAALLGYGNALDSYSSSFQNEAVRAKELSNKLTEAEVSRINLGIKVVKDKDTDSSKIFEQVFPCCKPQIFSLWPSRERELKRNAKDTEDE
jgi:hypothetical protein